MFWKIFKKINIKFIFLIVATVLFLCVAAFCKRLLVPIDKVENNIITEDGAWCWFQDPRAIQYKDKTYIGWVDKKGNIMIGSYDNNSKSFGLSNLHQNLQVDDHSAPAILVRNDGRLMVFYSAHVGNQMYYKISINPEDISIWSDEKKLGVNTSGASGYTYANPLQLSEENNKIYLFWRGGNFEPTFSFSEDNGVSWSSAITLFDVPGQRPYMKVFSNGVDKIYFTFTDGHPNKIDNNIYFTYYQNGSFYNADGSFIKKISELPLNVSDIDKVYDSTETKIKAWNWDVSADSFGNPVIVYVTFPSQNEHFYNYAYWNGTSWNSNRITSAGGSVGKLNEPYYSGGIALDHENPKIVYLSKEIDGVHEIEEWITSDGGG